MNSGIQSAAEAAAIPNRWVLLLSICVSLGLAHIGTSTMPFQIGALMGGRGRSASESGLFGLVEVGALSLAMILVADWMDRLTPRVIAIVGCLMAALANAALYRVQPFAPQLVLAGLAGCGYGLVFAAGVAAAAATSDPVRAYAIGNSGALLIIAGIIAILPALSGHFGPLGIFAALAGLSLLCAPLLMTLARGKRPAGVRTSAWRTPGAAGLLISWATFSAGTTAVYAFSERIGASLQLAPSTIGLVLSSGVFVGLLGTGTAAAIGHRVDRRAALVTGLLGCALSCVLVGSASALTLFVIGIYVYWIFSMFTYSYLLGTAAVLDPTGRVGTLGGGVERLGYGLGAAGGGFLVQHSSFSTTGVIGCCVCLLGVAAGTPRLFRALSSTE